MRILLSAFLALACLACSPASDTPPGTTNGGPALWRIRDADSEIWLFGSVHVLPPELEWQSPAVRAAFASAQEFVTETDMRDAAGAELAQLMQRYGTLPAGEQLSDLLTPAEAARLSRVTQRLGVDRRPLEGARPWLAALQLSYAHAARAGHSVEAGVESVLMREANARGMRFSFLETTEAQIRILADLSPDAQRALLINTISEIEEGEDGMRELDAAWARGDIATMARLLDAEWRNAGPDVHQAVILRRNRAWVENIVRRLEGSGTLFIAVGAAHLVGEGNVVALLRARGIAVEGP